MTGLSAAATLELWDAAERVDRTERALVLAAAAATTQAEASTPAALAMLPIGRRDAQVLELHSALAGPALEAVADCPACGATAEVAVDAVALLRAGAAAPGVERLDVDGYAVDWRPPDSRDVAAAAHAADATAAERVLLQRCVTSATGPDGPLDGPSLPPGVRRALAEAMAAADPLAELLVDVTCPACGAPFVANLDVTEYVWAEVRANARRVLREVHVLAREYGWSEAEVLALDERRRAAYLELAGGTPA